MKTQLDHINMTVKDLNESVLWYKKYFSFEVVESGTSTNGPYAVIQSGDSMLCLHERPTREALNGSSHSDTYHRIYHLGLRIENRQEWEKLFATEGFRVSYPSPVQYPHSISWYIHDPNGHEVEVVHWNKKGPNFSGTPKELNLGKSYE